ncbi:MAG: hypothetical protein ACXADD_17290 [Candidatus Thorarchaeota archaeon]|jgi:hypothetical protein
MGIPILSGIVDGLRVFFKTRRYVAYLIIFVFTTFLGYFVTWLMTIYPGTGTETILANFFLYVGATGTIYFAFGTLLIGIGADRLWITRRGRGSVTELKGVAWLAVSFAISVFLSLLVGREALLFFAMFCWVGWIAFQAYLSSRTSLRLATIAEPKKGGIGVGIGSFIVLIIGLSIIGGVILAALFLIPENMFGLGDVVTAIFPNAVANLQVHGILIWVAAGLLGLFALVSLLAFFRYAGKGAALNVALMTVFIAIYSGYFLVNVMRRTGAPTMSVVDIAMSLFFLLYAMSGIGRTVTEGVEETRMRTRDFGPLFTFFLASGFFFVDSIIAVSNSGATILAGWFDWSSSTVYETFIFRDIAKLLAFPLVAIFTSLYYLMFERVERVAEDVREERDAGEEIREEDLDKEIVEELEEPSEDRYGAPPSRDPDRLRVDDSRRLGKPKRFGEDDEDQ